MNPGGAIAWTIADRPAQDVRSCEELLSTLQKEKRPGAILQAFDLRSVASERHLDSAFLHAQRALEHGQGRIRDPGALLALYLAGSDQLEKSLDRVGIREDTRSILIVSAPACDLSEVVRTLGCTVSPRTLPDRPRRETLDRLGIEPRLYQHLPETDWEAVVLEQVALVDFGR